VGPAHTLCDALAALVLLEDLDAPKALTALLSARLAAFKAQLAVGTNAALGMGGAAAAVLQHGTSQQARSILHETSADEAADVLAEAASIVQATVAQVGG
jgi:hypothetical protein